MRDDDARYVTGQRNSTGQVICGSRKSNYSRDPTPCQSTIVMANGRCKMHGGASRSGAAAGAFKHGKYSKVLPVQLRHTYEESLTSDNLLTLQHEIALVDTLIIDRLAGLRQGGTHATWLQLSAVFDQFKTATAAKETTEAFGHLQALEEIIRRGELETRIKRELLDLLERRRRLVETERRMLVETGLMMTVQQLIVTVAVVVEIIERHVSDRTIRQAIGNDIRSFILEHSGGSVVAVGGNGHSAGAAALLSDGGGDHSLRP